MRGPSQDAPDDGEGPAALLSEDALARLVREFYASARRDPLLGPVFDGAVADWSSHHERVTAFWARAALGVSGYRGNPMAAHRKHALTPAMFDRWLQIWRQTAGELLEAETAAQIAGRAAHIAESLKLGLFFDPRDARPGGP